MRGYISFNGRFIDTFLLGCINDTSYVVTYITDVGTYRRNEPCNGCVGEHELFFNYDEWVSIGLIERFVSLRVRLRA